MPHSRWDCIPKILHIIYKLQPESVFDVGIGDARNGHLIRECIDQMWERYHKAEWTKILDGCEIFSSYITPAHQYYYDEIHIGDYSELVDKIGNYDLIFMGAVLEHFPKEIGKEIITKTLKKCKHLLIQCPNGKMAEEPSFGNVHEAHRSAWVKKDFKNPIEYWEDKRSIIVLLKGEIK